MQMATLFLLVTLMVITMTTGSVTISTALFASNTTHSYSEVTEIILYLHCIGIIQ